MSKPIFELFERVCSELVVKGSTVITEKDFGGALIDSLETKYHESDSIKAIQAAVDDLAAHFMARGAMLPFTLASKTGLYTTLDAEYISLIDTLSNARGIGRESKNFEITVSKWLSEKLTGDIHRVGWPRTKKKTRKKFVSHMKSLGFSGSVAYGAEKDGGFDVVWLPPLGAIPYRPIFSVQCKNARYDRDAADLSIMSVGRSLNEHSVLDRSVSLSCVLFNDYIEPDLLPRKHLNYLPLGLTDLAKLKAPRTLVQI